MANGKYSGGRREERRRKAIITQANYNINKIDEAASSGQGQLLKIATVLWGGG